MDASPANLRDPGAAARWAAVACGPAGAWAAVQLGLSLQSGACGPAGLATLLVAAPVLEEIVFRYGLHAWLRRKLPRPGGLLGAANLLTALAFGIAHAVRQQSVLMLLAALPAMLIGWIWVLGRERLAAPVALHAWYNACIAFASCP